MDTSLPDETLISLYCRGDERAFEALYFRHKQPVFNYFLRQCRNARPIADELSQEVWIRVIKSRCQFTRQATFKTFLFTIAHNLLIDHYRQTKVAQKLVLVDSEIVHDPDSSLAKNNIGPEEEHRGYQLAAAFSRHLECLPPDQREAFLLRREADMTIEQIAECTGVGLEAAKSRVRYATQKLREGLLTEGFIHD